MTATLLASACAALSSAAVSLLPLLWPQQPLWPHALVKNEEDMPNGLLPLCGFYCHREKTFVMWRLGFHACKKFSPCQLHAFDSAAITAAATAAGASTAATASVNAASNARPRSRV